MTDHLAIEAVGLTKTYDAVTVLSGLDLEVQRGSVFALLGPQRRRQDDHRAIAGHADDA
jgi:ABC-type sugar transport system ATPase subunit